MDEPTDMILHLTGQVEAADFDDWINRHAAKLGVEVLSSSARPGARHLQIRGPAQLLQALELACSLGPASVLVDVTALEPAGETQKTH